MKFKVGIDVEAWFMTEVEADDPRRAATQAMDRVDGIDKRLQAAGITWLSTEPKDYANIVVTDETGERSVFEAGDDYEEEEEEEEENTDRSSARSNL